MDYCGPRGIPHSQFLTWSPEDQDKAVAWMQGDRARCNGCGTYPDDWLTEDGQDLEPPPYEAASVLCLGCAALEEAREKIPKERSHMYHVYLRPYRGEQDGNRDQGGTGG